MKYVIEVKRNRPSVTQGSAEVYVNGEEMISFNDEIILIKQNEKYYGDLICGWASVTPDEEFIKGMLFHPYDEYCHHSEKFRKVINKAIQTKGDRYEDHA